MLMPKAPTATPTPPFRNGTPDAFRKQVKMDKTVRPCSKDTCA
jgi:hypothetical protein